MSRIGIMREAGMFQYWLKKSGAPNLYENPNVTPNHRGKALELIDLKSIFILWNLLIAFSFVNFIIENLSYVIKMNLKR